MILRIAIVSSALIVAGYAQTEFEVASVRVNPPQTGFHFGSDSGGPDWANPGMFRCTNCTLATLIRQAFNLQNYQFPGRSSLGTSTFDVMAKIPAGANQEDFQVMLQSLLKDRFGLAYHYNDKTMRGYHLVIAKNGSKLKESPDNAPSRQPQNGNTGQHGVGQGQGQSHAHTGLVAFGGSATYRGDHKTTGELAQILADQLSLPVDDQTKLPGKYDIALNWVGGNNGQSGGGNHAEGPGHGDHGGGPAGATASRRGDESGPTLFEALQSQLGLKLVPSEQTVARIFLVDHAEHIPTAN